MRRIAALLFALALVVAACGDDDGGAEETTTTTAAAETTTTTAAETTTTTAAPTTTTTAAPTTTAAANPALAAALALEGTYEGEWNNTTFGSTGPIELTIEVDEEAQVALLTLDLGGNVFGASDPDPVEYEVDLTADFEDYEVTDDVFGESTVEVGVDGHFVFESEAVPGLGGLPMTIEGDMTAEGVTGTYVIPDLAEGTFEAIPSN